ncbi:MAG: carbohydrate kinase family protein [Anaerolineae bacterium]|nr:carbohydrate kinase family protein [Anaerolineae bacterium]
MGKLLVSGLINIETTVRVDGFPVAYRPVRYPQFGINSTVSGVGYNVAKALTTLGSRVNFLSMIGQDSAGQIVHQTLRDDRIPHGFVIAELDQTPCSVILFDPDGRRAIHVDLKDIQERAYPNVLFEQAAHGCSLAVLCNINFSRPFLQPMRARGVPVATDVHAIAQLGSGYDHDFMRAADILFMSDELLPCSPEEWIRRLWDHYEARIAVIGLGADGALLAVRDDGFVERIPAVFTRPVVNTIGAGDALFSCFVHVYHRTGDPYAAIKQAVVFASYKIGATSAADGFLSESELNRLVREVMGE